MVDPTRPATPAPDDSWPAPDDVAVRRLVEALTADATREELADEARYVAAFEALGVPSGSTRTIRRGPRGRRGRLVMVGAVAALAVSGTAAAVTGTIGRTPAPSHRPPSSTSLPTVASERPVPARGTTTSQPPLPIAPASPRPTSEPSRTTTSSIGPSASSTRSTGRAPSPHPSASAHPPPTPALRAFCRAYLQGEVEEGSTRYRVLVEAAGGADRVTAYCTALVAAKSSP
ncbi:MAG TPA: hypothetical protein VEV65_02290 [Kineosporiaceae bacterium]|nr:hypothetical protein [Kineosporiaceae bacterium]